MISIPDNREQDAFNEYLAYTVHISSNHNLLCHCLSEDTQMKIKKKIICTVRYTRQIVLNVGIRIYRGIWCKSTPPLALVKFYRNFGTFTSSVDKTLPLPHQVTDK